MLGHLVPYSVTKKKHYSFGNQIIAVRENNQLRYLAGDHLNSTSFAMDETGNKTAQVRYYPYGQTWSEELYQGDTRLPTDKTYTGQRSENFGVMDYNARYYSPLLGRFLSPDTYVPESQGVQAWDRYAYVNNNPINATDPTGHAMKLDDEGNTRGCPANTCYIVKIGSTPGLPYYTPSPTTYAENAMLTSSAGGTPDGGVAILPDVTFKGATVKQPTFREPNARVGALLLANDLLVQHRNAMVEFETSKINVFAFYKVESGGISVMALDIQNPAPVDITVRGVRFVSASEMYSAVPGASIHATNDQNYYGFSPVVKGNSATTVSLVPSGYSFNNTNFFAPNESVNTSILLRQTQTGYVYKRVEGTLR